MSSLEDSRDCFSHCFSILQGNPLVCGVPQGCNWPPCPHNDASLPLSVANTATQVSHISAVSESSMFRED